MKKIIALLVVIFVLFAVYLLKTDTGLTQKLLKPVVVYQCGVELEATRLWKVSTALIDEQVKKQVVQQGVLNTLKGCVVDEVLKATD
ncbi:hypothetical protein [Acinetobacter johnsonii]|uniref:hypothetical protein n=1 Tax=Acinetobacter johnsonii TaxID=40214 RepID=UPI002168E205|nr:hypothetical protein [Acinetobacter johnsonii]MCS3526369.1 hypothetical protein [Acinetobacter johnsonii]